MLIRFLDEWTCPFPHGEPVEPDLTLHVTSRGAMGVQPRVDKVDQGHDMAIT